MPLFSPTHILFIAHPYNLNKLTQMFVCLLFFSHKKDVFRVILNISTIFLLISNIDSFFSLNSNLSSIQKVLAPIFGLFLLFFLHVFFFLLSRLHELVLESYNFILFSDYFASIWFFFTFAYNVLIITSFYFLCSFKCLSFSEISLSLLDFPASLESHLVVKNSTSSFHFCFVCN